MNNSNQKNFEYLPSVQQVLETLADDTASIKQTYLTVLVREELETLRGRIRSTRFAPKSRQQALTIIKNNVQARTREMISTPIKKVINATGVVLHTGLGRAPLGERPLQYLMNIASGYLNLEFDLKNGKRGERLDLTDPYLRLLTGMESSAIVNNNAAAVMISLNSIANRKEVIVSRGELIEIGGSFRLPDVMKKSGAKMVEVGTTNRTHLGDYENAINPKTGAILIAHTSNYRVKGFTTKPPEPDIVELAHKHNIPVIMDLGSGALIPTGDMGLPEEPPISAAVNTGFDVITFSGDKLLGGPQAGLIVGKSSYIKKIRKNPLMRRDQLRSMAQQVVQKIQNQVNDCLTIEICDTSTEAGSGSMPTELIPSVAIRIGTNRISEEKLSRFFRQQDPPVVGYLKDRQTNKYYASYYYWNSRTYRSREIYVNPGADGDRPGPAGRGKTTRHDD